MRVLVATKTPDRNGFQCSQCWSLIDRRAFEDNLCVCPKCGFHYKISSTERIKTLADEESWESMNDHLQPSDALGFHDSKPYSFRIKQAQKKSGLTEAIKTGTARLEGRRVALSVMDFGFMGGSMGSVVGEKFARLCELALEKRLPVISVATSGGARMQESILSLMQMAKTSAVCSRLSEAGIPFISVLTDPTTAGVLASFAGLGNVVVAEPGALIGFAGPRVIQQTISHVLPPEFQRSESVLAHGFLDVVVERKHLKQTLSDLISCFWDEPRDSAKALALDAH